MAQQDKQNASSDAMKEIEVQGSQLVDKVREIVTEGNARRVLIRKDGETILEVPLSVGAGAATAAVLLHPVLAALGAVGALMTNVKVLVEPRTEEGGAGGSGATPPPPKPSK